MGSVCHSAKVSTWGRGLGKAAKEDRKSTRLNSSHGYISYAVFCLTKKEQAADRRRWQAVAAMNREHTLFPINTPASAAHHRLPTRPFPLPSLLTTRISVDLQRTSP